MCNDHRAPAAGILVAQDETRHRGRMAEMRMHGFPQRARALALHDPNATQTALPTLGEIVVEQAHHLGRAKGMQVQFPRDRDPIFG